MPLDSHDKTHKKNNSMSRRRARKDPRGGGKSARGNSNGKTKEDKKTCYLKLVKSRVKMNIERSKQLI